MLRLAKKLLPESAKAAARRWVRGNHRLEARSILSTLYDPWPGSSSSTEEVCHYFDDPLQLRDGASREGLALPPDDWRQGYYLGDDAGYLRSGRIGADHLRSIWDEHGLKLGQGDAVMDWGCASGRVLRHFVGEAEAAEFWGVDVDARLIKWAKENLSPPFHFVTGSAFPHLPFEDGKFTFIFGFSVFTHLEHLQD